LSLSTTSIDTTIYSALISAVVAFIILALSKFLIEPRQWRSRYEIRSLEKALEVHGSLIAVLDGCHGKALLANVHATAQYRVDSHDIRELETIFERKSYLLSEALREQWSNLHLSQSHFGALKAGTYASLDLPLKDMRDLAETDFKAYSERYAKLTSFKPPTS